MMTLHSSLLLGILISQDGSCAFFFLGLFRAEPAAYGSSQARGRIRAAAYTTAIDIATQDPRHVCHLHHGSRQSRILNPLSDARDRIQVLMDTSQVHEPLSHDKNSLCPFVILALCKWCHATHRNENLLVARPVSPEALSTSVDREPLIVGNCCATFCGILYICSQAPLSGCCLLYTSPSPRDS